MAENQWVCLGFTYNYYKWSEKDPTYNLERSPTQDAIVTTQDCEPFLESGIPSETFICDDCILGGGGRPNIQLMVQKSGENPPGMVLKPCR